MEFFIRFEKKRVTLDILFLIFVEFNFFYKDFYFLIILNQLIN